MGWTSYYVEPIYKNGKRFIDRKAECDKLFNCDMIDNIGKFEVLKSTMIGSTYYAAVKRTTFDPESTKVFAAVVLTHTNNKDYYNFAYKDMDESVGPCESKCPKSILDLLSPTENDYAKEWRKRCYENLKEKKNPDTLANLPIGSVIRYVHHDGKEMKLIKSPAAYQFKRPFWMVVGEQGYIPSKYIPKNYEVIKRGEK